MTFDEVQSLFEQLCNEQSIAKVEFDASESATMPVGDAGMVLHIQYRRDVGDVVFLAPLGEIPDVSAAFVLEALLSANLYWRATSGATLAWSVDLQQPVLQYAVPTENLTAAGLATTLEDYLVAANGWRENIAELAAAEPLDPEPDDNEEEEEEEIPRLGADSVVLV